MAPTTEELLDFRFCGFGQFLVRFFAFGDLYGLWVFSNSFGFLSTMIVRAVFWIFLSNGFYGFSGFAKEVTPLQSR